MALQIIAYAAFLLGLVLGLVSGQGSSPCPDIFKYEPRDSSKELDRWYGVVSISSAEDLDGVYLKIFLDRHAELLGNWFTDATSTDNVRFSLNNPTYKLEAGHPVSIRFFVKYNTASTVPRVSKILLNGKTICAAGNHEPVSPTQPTLHISKPATESSVQSPLKTKVVGIADEAERTPSTRVNGQTTGNGLAKDGYNEEDSSSVYLGDFTVTSTSKPMQVPGQKKVQCGTAAVRPTALISHGQYTSPGQWPWHIALYQSTGLEVRYICGGTLISNTHVVTAAHCVTRPRTSNPVNQKQLLVYLGKYSLLTFGPDVQDREVEKIFVHPQYNHSTYFNDIAILKLNKPAEFTNYIRPCCLWQGGTDAESIINQQGTVVGWGFDENKMLSKNLMQAEMPVVSTIKCIYSNRDFFSQFTFENNYCAGFRNGTSACNGDSGGGMVFPRSGTNGQNIVWQLRGIVSVGVALQTEGVCDTSHYIIFTDAAKYLSWIKQIIGE